MLIDESALDKHAGKPNVIDMLDVFNACEDSVVIFDADWRYALVNDVGWKVLGRRKEDVLGKVVWELLPHLKGSDFEQIAHKSMEDQVKMEIEEFYPHRNEHFRTAFYPSKHFLMVVITNITDYVRAKEIYEQLMGDLQQAMELYWSDENRFLRDARKKGRGS